MRNIKFRAWDKEGKRMCYDVLHNIGFDGVVMQYTGLKDKNGKEIWEGDIVKLPNEHYRMYREAGNEITDDGIYQIHWSDTTASFHGKEQDDFGDGLYIWLVARYSEVIGNIYENPDLLLLKIKKEF